MQGDQADSHGDGLSQRPELQYVQVVALAVGTRHGVITSLNLATQTFLVHVAIAALAGTDHLELGAQAAQAATGAVVTGGTDTALDEVEYG